jgi:hypothetical protein
MVVPRIDVVSAAYVLSNEQNKRVGLARFDRLPEGRIRDHRLATCFTGVPGDVKKSHIVLREVQTN